MPTRIFVLLIFTISFVYPRFSFAQGLKPEDRQLMVKKEDSLVQMADSMFNAYLPDDRPRFCEKFVKHLVAALKTENSFNYDFPLLRKKINLIYPSDKTFRVFNWFIIGGDHEVRYYGAIQMPTQSLKLIPLIDHSKEIGENAEDTLLTAPKWFGALYYRIVETEADGVRYYNFFGLNSSSLVSNKKVVDPMYFDGNEVVFGAQIFNVKSETKKGRIKRYIMEYKKDVQASLNWDEEAKTIYFDKLVSQSNDPNRKYTFVPSGQYDGFRWGGGQWNYIQDLIPVQTFKDGEAPAPRPLKGQMK
ncbi:MAG: hypothetical protein JST52_03455 [Bacteroidetes bacterium]|nr:hypothetical protein [Bacteroidota bacterium]MBS1738912.1 hypothetical protein [Bacteroidota bacterium]